MYADFAQVFYPVATNSDPCTFLLLLLWLNIANELPICGVFEPIGQHFVLVKEEDSVDQVLDLSINTLIRTQLFWPTSMSNHHYV